MNPQITLYTAHHCPFAHRVQVALRELGLPFETSLIDITVPRSADYLAINPSGLVPALVYDSHVLTESGLIAQFLVDTHASHLVLPTSKPGGPLQRFKIGYFVDAYFNKAHPSFNAIVFSPNGRDKADMARKYVDAVANHIEPLLADAAPFFGGSDRLTLAEILTSPFILRVVTLPKYEYVAPKSILLDLQDRAPNFWKWAIAVVVEHSVTAVWDEDLVVKHTLAKIKNVSN